MQKAEVSAETWRKSSFSEAGNCVAVSDEHGRVLVRDTKVVLAESSILSFSPPTWREFIETINNR